ncbi:MAG: outer membrane protein assembly factor BamA [Verrucomicrobiota bacterium]
MKQNYGQSNLLLPGEWLRIAVALLAVVWMAAPVAAQEPTVVQPPTDNNVQTRGPEVKEIEIIYIGPKLVSRAVILSNMRTTIGQPFSARAVEEDVRNLYATGFFVNLRIQDEPVPGGVKVVVIVQPKPLIKEIVIRGNEKISTDRILKEVGISNGDPLSEQQVAEGERKIREYYQDKGYEKIKVSYKIDINEQFGRAVVTYTVQEGERNFVAGIEFEGNKSFKAGELRKLFKTRKKGLLSFIDGSGVYKDAQFKDDLRNLRLFYQDKGFIDMQIKDVKYEYPKKERMVITIVIFEGIEYRVGRIQFQGNTLFTTPQIRSRLVMKEGDIFSPSGLGKNIEAIEDLYGERGYIDTRVSPERLANVESGRMDLLFVVSEGPQSFIEKITIQGNSKTKDKVIRRELAVAPGEVYDSVLVDASKKRLENLAYFEKVDIAPRNTNVPNRKDMVVTVQEKRTGSISFGAGFSSVDSLLGFVEVSQSNFDLLNFPYFVGAGQKFRVRAQYGIQRQDFVISFTEPWFLDRRLSLGVELFARQNDFDNAEYNQRNFGGAVTLARALGQFWTASIGYTFQNIDIFDVDGNASQIIQDEEGSRSQSSITMGLVYDTRDNIFLPRAGEKVNFTTQLSGGPLLGQTDVYKFEVDARKWVGLPWYDLILSFGASTGTVERYDDTTVVPLFDRFFEGGARSVRGFETRDVGPKDFMTGDPIGGQTYVTGDVELTFPIIDRVRGALFTDFGWVNEDAFNWDVTVLDQDEVDDNTIPFFPPQYGYGNFNLGVGFGFRLNLPVGPLNVDLGFPIFNDRFNGGGPKFSFDVGYQF